MTTKQKNKSMIRISRQHHDSSVTASFQKGHWNKVGYGMFSMITSCNAVKCTQKSSYFCSGREGRDWIWAKSALARPPSLGFNGVLADIGLSLTSRTSAGNVYFSLTHQIGTRVCVFTAYVCTRVAECALSKATVFG